MAELLRAKRACGAPWVSKSTHPRKFGNHVTVYRPPARPSAPQGNQCLILTLSSQFGSAGRLILHTCVAHQCCDQLTAVKPGYPLTSITWPYRGLRCRPIKIEYFFEVISADNLLVFKWSQAQIFFKFISNLLCLCHYRPALLRFWFQTDLRGKNSARFLKYSRGRPFLTMITCWSRSTSKFYALIG